MKLIKKTVKVLESYGITINELQNLKDNQQAIYTKDMIIFVNENDQSIGISFFASTKPEHTANLTLALNTIKSSKLYIMESFVFNEDDEYISGNEAFKLLKDSHENNTMQKFTRNQHYEYMLDNHKGFEC